ncbi:L-fucose mutarotase [Roseibium sp. TrichSKD4]|uniref:RbsD/FucU family protein n=1 Tax=Roseibium sp. TrichSKD4 TaxID=744980 RepID=UPI0001E56D10|nr:RbsD/FucU domain-containing protein [Roseibium sp. TrichSKD4]EFO30230.1 L-fucose mutarotase [Roseibium sp. TrichSKD4]
MLTGIDPRMTADLLYCLARMGHGDELVLADRNYPSVNTARTCCETSVIDLPGLNAPEAADIISALMPLDGFTDYAALRMEIDGAPKEIAEVHMDVWDVLRPRLPEGGELKSIERQSFYSHARKAFAVVQTTEDRPFGCFILRKGVVF